MAVLGKINKLYVGQCNDAYSAVRIATALADAFDIILIIDDKVKNKYNKYAYNIYTYYKEWRIIFMWCKEVSLKSKVTKDKVWKIYSDVSNWNKWDDTTEYSEIEGDFALSCKGLIKSKGGPESKFIVSNYIHLSKFTMTSKLPLARLDFIHEISQSSDYSLITHRIEIKGPLSFLFGPILGGKIIKDLPKTLNKLVEIAKA